MGVEGKEIIHPKNFHGGAAILPKDEGGDWMKNMNIYYQEINLMTFSRNFSCNLFFSLLVFVDYLNIYIFLFVSIS